MLSNIYKSTMKFQDSEQQDDEEDEERHVLINTRI